MTYVAQTLACESPRLLGFPKAKAMLSECLIITQIKKLPKH